MNRSVKPYLIALLVFSAIGLLFSGVATYDFVAYLDRQVHAITCSYFPGLGAPDTTGSSGCHAVMMSPYSSVLRARLWGGIPIALPAFGVFAYLVFVGADLLVRRMGSSRNESRYLMTATALPLLTSIVYFVVSLILVGTLCKVCIGIYLSSIGVFACALLVHLANRRLEVPQEEGLEIPWMWYGIRFIQGVLFVLLPVLCYLALKPDVGGVNTECGTLPYPEDRYGVKVRLNTPEKGGIPAIEILDPLCTACAGFDLRLKASDFIDRLELDVVLFPLDHECNWMVDQTLHPGACAVSEAVLCAADKAGEVLEWAFANQEEIKALAAKGQDEVYKEISRQFPALKTCVGSPKVRARLNRSLRWIVHNSLPVLTPQLYVRGQKLCDEDTDLGLEYTLTRMLEEDIEPDGSTALDEDTWLDGVIDPDISTELDGSTELETTGR